MGLQLTGQDSIDSVLSEASTSCSGAHKCLAILRGQSLNDVTALALSGECLYAGSSNGEIRAWDHPDMQELGAKFGQGAAAVKCLVVVENQIISAHQDHKIRVWRRSKSQPHEHRLVSTLPLVKDYITNFLPSKNYVQVRRHHKSLWINHNDSIAALAVGNGVLYSGSWDKSVKVWRLKDFKCLESLTHHIDAVNALAVDNACSLLFSGSGDATIKVLRHQPDRRGHTVVATLESRSPVNALAVAHPGLLYSAQSDRTVTVWRSSEDDNSSWTAVAALRGHRLAVLAVVTVSDLVVSGSADKTVRVWRRGGDGVHSAVAVMTGHSGPVKSLCAVMDSLAMDAVVYSGSMDGSVRVWWIPENEADLVSSDDGSVQHSPVLVNGWRRGSNRTLPRVESA